MNRETPRPKMSFAWILAAACLALLMSSCAHIGYYAQSVSGQLDIWQRERPIQEVINDPATPAELKRKLARVIEIRAFASKALGLPDNSSYRTYADLERQYVVWNVFATPEFSLHPVHWCFPVAGCVGYRGYFAKAAADRFAAELAGEGYDVFVGGVPAYSTLGWFSDPVLNTIMQYPEPSVARMIFHELAHQVVYVRNDSVFNESFAVAVQREGVRRWLETHGSVQDNLTYQEARNRHQDFLALIETYHKRLAALYASELKPELMRERKKEAFDNMMRDYGTLKASWGGYAGYDRWFAQRPNNAQLASVAIYTKLIPGFQALLRQQGGDLPRFYAAVKELAALPKDERTARLEQLAAER